MITLLAYLSHRRKLSNDKVYDDKKKKNIALKSSRVESDDEESDFEDKFRRFSIGQVREVWDNYLFWMQKVRSPKIRMPLS